MAFPLGRLPQEIVGTYVVRHLAAEDVVSLFQCIEFPVNETLYCHCYPDDPHFAHYDAKMFRERAEAKLCLIKEPDQKPRGGHTRKRVHLPAKKAYKVIDLDKTVVQAAPSNNRAVLVTHKGELYSADHGSLFPKSDGQLFVAPLECDHLSDDGDDYDKQACDLLKSNVEKNASSHNANNVEDYEDGSSEVDYEDDSSEVDFEEDVWNLGYHNNSYHVDNNNKTPSGLVELSDKFFTKPRARPRFVQVCVGDCVLALDSEGLPWTDNGSGQMVPFCLARKCGSEVITEKVVKVGYLRGRMLFLLEGGRLASRRATDSDGNLKTGINPDGYRSGYPCSGGHLCYIYVDRGENHAAGPFFMFLDILVFLRSFGYLEADYLGEEDPNNCPNYNLTQCFDCDLGVGEFKTMTACQSWIYLTTTDGKVVCIDVDEAEGMSEDVYPRVVTGLENLEIVSILAGSGRCLLLTKERDVYWFPLKMNRGQMKNGTVVVGPEKLNLPGKAFRLFGEGGFAGVLV